MEPLTVLWKECETKALLDEKYDQNLTFGSLLFQLGDSFLKMSLCL